MSYQITKLLGPAHGHACALTLPILWDMLTVNEETQETMKELAARMRLGDPQMGSRLIRGLMIDLDMPLPDMPDEESLYDLAELFKIFGDTTRIRILYVLFESEMCVCDIAELLHMTQSAISHQLRLLKQFKLVKNRREGKTVYYSLADDHVRSIIGQGMEHIKE